MTIIGNEETMDGQELTAESIPAETEHAAAGTEEYRFEFRGSTMEYFRIFQINVLLTILTAGIYSAWAKVRNKHYFYGNTFIYGANFEYHASPVSILVARLIIFAVIIGGVFWAGEDIVRNAYYSLFLGLLLPWALVRGLSFNARNSSWAVARFIFNRRYAPIYLLFAPLLIYNFLQAALFTFLPAGILTEEMEIIVILSGVVLLVLIAPWMARAYHRYKIANHSIGGVQFFMEKVSLWQYIKALFVLPTLAVALPGVLLWSLLTLFPRFVHQLASTNTEYIFFLYFLSTALGFLVGFIYIFISQAALFRVFWDNVRAANGAVFSCRLSIPKFAFSILFVNFLAIILSLGLLYPWAKVRKVRYFAAHIYLTAPAGALDGIMSAAAEKSALGEELDAVEGFDFDVGLV